MNPNLKYELILLGLNQEFEDNHESSVFLQRLFSNDYLQTLKEDCMKDVWKYPESTDDEDDLENHFKKIVEKFIRENEKYSPEIRQLLVLVQGVAFLQLFVQNNWTGPPISVKPSEVLEPILGDAFKSFHGGDPESIETKLNVFVLNSLFEETCATKVNCPEYLWFAQLLLISCKQHLHHCVSASWWSLRCAYVHQQILDERSPKLAEIAEASVESGKTSEPLMTDEKLRCLHIQFNLEASRLLEYYYNISSSKEHLNMAQKLSGLSLTISGALGKRTYYQQEDKSQLLLRIERKLNDGTADVHNCSKILIEDFPKDLKLNDNVRMNSIIFKESVDQNEVDLLPVEQAVVLNLFYHIRKSNAFEKLIEEELMVYLMTILSQPKNWSIQTTALYWRSILESDHHRTIERAMMQLQVLVDNFSSLSPSGFIRKDLFYCVGFPPIWQIEQKLADIYKKMGAMSSALDIYLKLEKWEEVIRCYYHLNKKHQAEEIIREQLKIKETPSMLCFLGDVTDDSQYYLQAWELSGCRSARAQKGLALLHFNKQQYRECIPYFKKSLEINHLQLEVWSSLAYAAMSIEDWELTAEAYRKCLNLEPDNFMAWNNLSNAYIKLNQKPRAWKTLQEALKCNFDDWRIWENYLLVSTDCGAFDEVVTAYHRILDLKEKHVDCEVLSILVKAVTDNLSDNSGNPSRCYLPNALKLFGRLTAQVTNNSTVWILYAELTSLDGEKMQFDKVAQYLQRAYRCATFHIGWEKDSNKRQDITDLTLKLSDVYLKCSEVADSQLKLQFLTSGKLAVKGIINKLKRQNNSQLEPSEDIEMKINALGEKLKEYETFLSNN